MPIEMPAIDWPGTTTPWLGKSEERVEAAAPEPTAASAAIRAHKTAAAAARLVVSLPAWRMCIQEGSASDCRVV